MHGIRIRDLHFYTKIAEFLIITQLSFPEDDTCEVVCRQHL